MGMESKEEMVINHFKKELGDHMEYMELAKLEPNETKKMGLTKIANEELSHAKWLHQQYKCVQELVEEMGKMSELAKTL